MFPLIIGQILIALGSGIFIGTQAHKTVSYCECYRSNFDGKYCQSIKGSGTQGSCQK